MRARHAHTIKLILRACQQVKRAKKALHKNVQGITRRTVTLGQKWDPFGSHFVHMNMLHFGYQKRDPNGSRNRKFARRESETNKKIFCTGPHVTFWKIDIISSNLTKDEQNRPSGSRDMAVYFHGLIKKNWWFWVLLWKVEHLKLIFNENLFKICEVTQN